MIHKRGFTLIELLAVVMIIGILTGIAVPQYRKSILRAEAAEGLTNLRAVFTSARRYKAQNSVPPTALNQLDIGFYDLQVDLSVGSSGGSFLGNYEYSFTSSGVSACLLGESDLATAQNTYCFSMYYNNTTYGQDALVCESYNKKYTTVCEAFCDSSATPNSSGLIRCVIP